MVVISFIEHVPFAIFSVVGVVAVGALLGYPVSRWISEKVADFLSFFPTTQFNEAVPLLSRGQTLAMQGQLAEAAAIYESFLEEHPDNLEIYINLVDLAYGPLDDHAYGSYIIQLGDEHLTPRGQRVLRIHREAILRGELYPLQHLGWRKDQKTDHPEVSIPEALKGQFSKKPS